MPRTNTKGEASRARILEAAAAVFAARGYHEAKISDIVAAAGLTQAAFYLYFPSKDSVLEVLVNSFRAGLAELAARGHLGPGLAGGDVLEAARSNFPAVFRFFAADPNLTRVALKVSPSGPQLMEAITAMVAANLQANQAAGYLRSDIPPEAAARCLVAMVERLALSDVDPDRSGMLVADIFFNGLLPREGAK